MPADPPHLTRVPPVLAAAEPPVIGVPQPPAAPDSPTSSVRQVLAVFLSLYVGLFLVDALISLVDDSLILFIGLPILTFVRGTVFLVALVMAMVVYGLMGFTPMIPKRWFLPLTLFGPVASLAVLLLMIFFYNQMRQVSWGISLVQVLFGLGMLCWIQGGFKFRVLPIAAERLGTRGFSVLNLLVFVLVNAFVLLPAVVVYLGCCAAVGVNHLSAGFVSLRSDGVTLQVRDYVRADGKTIRLIPMAHIGEASFYRELSQSFSTNALILMEGVTDSGNLLTNKITYRRMASSLGLAEQAEEFQPQRAEVVHADVDVEVFTTNTIGFINLVMLVHTRGVNLETLLPLLQYSPPPQVEKELLDDLLGKRNRHLLEQIQNWLPESENLVVPWGAAHMPGLAREIEQLGFRLGQTRDYRVIRWRPARHRTVTAK